jgi:hypothetical protein
VGITGPRRGKRPIAERWAGSVIAMEGRAGGPEEDAVAERETGLALELIGGGADLTGAATGAALGLIGGPVATVGGAAVGVVAARGLRRVLAEIQQRLGGPRQRMRARARRSWRPPRR